MCFLLELSLKKYDKYIELGKYELGIIRSGIDTFDNTKKYIDTSCVDGVNNISSYELITYNKRPSRANMQPIKDSVWFAKMKDSYKILILTNYDIDIIDETILSTGYQGLYATDKLPLTYLAALVISKDFKTQRDLNSVGTTMAGINNETLLKMRVPYLDAFEMNKYDKEYKPIVEKLSLLRQEISQLTNIKNSLLNKYF